MADEQDDLDILDDEDEENDETDTDGDGDGGDSSDPKEGAEKRIRDLQSARDKETARANKLAAELEKLRRGEGGGDGNSDPAQQALMEDLREASLDAVYGEFAELREYNIDRSLIEGTSRKEIRESAQSVVALIKSVSTKARNKALADAGIKAEPAGSTRKPPVDYENMSDEDFAKLLDRL